MPSSCHLFISLSGHFIMLGKCYFLHIFYHKTCNKQFKFCTLSTYSRKCISLMNKHTKRNSSLPIKLSERHTMLSKGMVFLPGKSNFPKYVLQKTTNPTTQAIVLHVWQVHWILEIHVLALDWFVVTVLLLGKSFFLLSPLVFMPFASLLM